MKYEINEIMTLREASEIYGINLQTLKNKLKPSIVGKDKIEKWVSIGLIRKSSDTWLITEEFVKKNFKI